MYKKKLEKPVFLIAHRGLSSLETENTIAAFESAAKQDFDGIECDIQLTLDDQFVVFHDDTLNRLADKDIWISKTLYSDLKKIYLFKRGTQTPDEKYIIPTLVEFIKICKTYQKHAIIELKTPLKPDQIESFVNLVKDCDYLNKITFISFYLDNLMMLRRSLPTASIQFLTDNISGFTCFACQTMNFILSVHHSLINQEAVQMIKSYNINFGIWTVNDIVLARKMIDLGAQYLTTDGF